jgi:S-adenosylmethionine-diacylgycerolhomoserine-N-methlytransferase
VLRPERYTVSAPAYELISGERPVYRAARAVSIAGLRLTPGCSVLDLGCGTGLNYPLLVGAVGPAGTVVGIDRSPQMLTQARLRATRHGWSQVRTVQGDLLDGPGPAGLGPSEGGPAGYDALIATYALSLVPRWEHAWAHALAAVRPGGRIAVVDLALPTGRGAVLSPLARLACAFGGSDPHAHPWTVLERDCTDVTAHSLWGGHVQVRVGTRPN